MASSSSDRPALKKCDAFVRCLSTEDNDQGFWIKEVEPFGRIAGNVARTTLKAACSGRTYSTLTSALSTRLNKGKAGARPLLLCRVSAS